jgi:GMP synthase (glutamine-hydrolysing)
MIVKTGGGVRLGRERIAILDFGGQYTHLIANRIRRLGVYSEILLPTSSVEEVRDAKGIILSGGPSSVYSEDAPPYNPELLRMGKPILGICYGHQLIASFFGGEVVPGRWREYGIAKLKICKAIGIFKGLGPEEDVWMSHGDLVSRIPDGFELLGMTDGCPNAAIGDMRRSIFGVQFHPEVSHTPKGMEILSNFLDICGCKREWSMGAFLEEVSERIRREVGERNVLVFVSGGVDSTLTFFLLNKVLGKERVLGLYIDNGFMRKGETEGVRRFLIDHGLDNIKVIDASDLFLSAVEGVVDPQEKRRIIGDVFLSVRDMVLSDLSLDPDKWMLGQGTLYPDIIESGGSRHAAVIKTHHNRVERVKDLIEMGLVIEPLDQLYKDEVRELARLLGLPKELIERHPFPGPGLATRVLCSYGEDMGDSGEKEGVLKIARDFGMNGDVLPIRSVGVQGDSRTYAKPAVIWGRRPDWEELELISTRITNEVHGVNRVLYLLIPDELPPLKPKKAFLTKDRLDILREADSLAMDVLRRHGLMGEIFQMPVVLLPLSSGGEGECIVLRPLESKDVMTARFARIPYRIVEEMAREVMKAGTFDAVFYDITNKPPATIEWE